MKFFAVILCLALLWSSPAYSQSELIQEVEALREEIETLKEGQETIQKELKEIKDLLRGMQTTQSPVPKEIVVSTDDDPFKGEVTARLTLIEFSDYQCPFCARFSRETLAKIEEEYIKTGKVKYVFRDFPITSIHKDAVKAAEAANCAGEQGRYWDMHDQLFMNQNALGLKELSKYAQALGLSLPNFESCLKVGKYAQEVQRDLEDGLKVGVRGTPTFFLGFTNPNENSIKALKFIAGAQPYEKFKEAIEALLSEEKK